MRALGPRSGGDKVPASQKLPQPPAVALVRVDSEVGKDVTNCLAAYLAMPYSAQDAAAISVLENVCAVLQGTTLGKEATELAAWLPFPEAGAGIAVTTVRCPWAPQDEWTVHVLVLEAGNPL